MADALVDHEGNVGLFNSSSLTKPSRPTIGIGPYIYKTKNDNEQSRDIRAWYQSEQDQTWTSKYFYMRSILFLPTLHSI